MTALLEILDFSKEYLAKHGFEKARLEAEKIISDVLKLDRISLYAYFDKELTNEERDKIRSYLSTMASKHLTYDELIKENGSKDIDHQQENRDLLIKSIEYLEKNGVSDPKIDAEYIFAAVLNVKRSMLSLNFRKKIDESQRDLIRQMLIRRGKNREPLQYILGEWEFYGIRLKLDKRVLIPRADTEILVEQCKHILEDMPCPKVLDIGCGSGAISIAIAKEVPEGKVTGIDISQDAVDVALINGESNFIKNVEFLRSDLFSSIQEKKYDMIISNPPYIAYDVYQKLMPEVLKYEPEMALTDKENGYSFYERISKQASDHLNDGGYLAFEIGYDQREKVEEIMKKNKYDIVLTCKDYGGNDRVIIGKRTGDI